MACKKGETYLKETTSVEEISLGNVKEYARLVILIWKFAF
jgi:hypothetical protein